MEKRIVNVYYNDYENGFACEAVKKMSLDEVIELIDNCTMLEIFENSISGNSHRIFDSINPLSVYAVLEQETEYLNAKKSYFDTKFYVDITDKNFKVYHIFHKDFKSAIEHREQNGIKLIEEEDALLANC